MDEGCCLVACQVKKIQRLFDRYNQRFWKVKLRGWTVDEVHCSDGPPKKGGESGACSNETREIFIQIGLSPAVKRLTLLHEMCHAAAQDRCHDQPWQEEMIRIGEMGAPGVAKEARSYKRRLLKLKPG
jgi:hypothetical protein